MVPDRSIEYSGNEKKVLEGIVESRRDPLPFLPSEIQLQNIFAIEMTAKRFPVDMDGEPVARLGIVGVAVDSAEYQAQVELSVSLEFTDEPHPFDISFNLLGRFTYAPQFKPADVVRFLEMGSLSIMLPFARELLLSICTRLQIPPIILPMVKLAPPPSFDEMKEDTPE